MGNYLQNHRNFSDANQGKPHGVIVAESVRHITSEGMLSRSKRTPSSNDSAYITSKKLHILPLVSFRLKTEPTVSFLDRIFNCSE